MGRRIRWLGLVLILAFAAVLVQLVNIQERDAQALNDNKTNPRITVTSLDNQRGLILAATGAVLARSRKVPHPAVGQQQYYRTYPDGSLYSGIVGYASSYYGTAGVEYAYNTFLGLHTHPAQSLGQLLNPPESTTDNVTLTVIPSLQAKAQQQLNSIPDTNKDGAVVVESVTTGAILAMYSSPAYTNNGVATPTRAKERVAGQADFHTPDHEGYLAYPPMAVWDTFAPGSTFKVVTSTAVYNLKPTLDGFTYKVAGCTGKGAIPDTTHQICNDATTPTAANPCGGNLTQMLPPSCDPGYGMLGLHLGATTLYQQATLFGYNQAPPLDLYPVNKSNFPLPATFKPTGRLGPSGVALSAFGQQTVASTALQGAMVAQGVADTGKVMTPHVMSQIRDATGRLVKAYTPTVYKQAATATAAQAVNRLMQGVITTPKGTAYGVGFPKTMDAAVKTGTAQAGPGNNQTVDWMIGFAPASAPRVAVCVMVPQQAVSASGASIAGPITKTMLAAALAVVPARTTPPASAPPPPNSPPVVTDTGTPATAPAGSGAVGVPGTGGTPGGATSATTPPVATPTTAAQAATPTTVAPTTVAPTTTTATAAAAFVRSRPPPNRVVPWGSGATAAA